MKNSIKISFILIALMVSFNFLWSESNETVKYKINGNSKLWFDGTSTLHDYTCYAKEINGEVLLEPSSSKPVGNLVKVSVSIPVKKITNKSDDLTENMQEALKADEYPKIKYRLDRTEFVSSDPSKNSMVVKAYGKLLVSGKERDVVFDVNLTNNGNGELFAKGNTSILMSQFGIDRPSFFLGTLKTGDEVKIYFDIDLTEVK